MQHTTKAANSPSTKTKMRRLMDIYSTILSFVEGEEKGIQAKATKKFSY